MLKISHAASAQFTLEMCVAASNRKKKSLKHYFSSSRSFNVVDVGTPGKLVSSDCYDDEQLAAGL